MSARDVERIIAGVLAQAARDAGAVAFRVREDGSPEAELLRRCLRLVPETPVIARGDAAGPALELDPAHKTALVLAVAPPAAPLLPLGDLWATDVRLLVGDCTLPGAVAELAEAVGGLDALDAALRAHFDERRPAAEALAPLPEPGRGQLLEALRVARFARAHMGLVPKLGPRTLGIDLFA